MVFEHSDQLRLGVVKANGAEFVVMFATGAVPRCAQVRAADETYAGKPTLKLIESGQPVITGDDDFHRRRINLSLEGFEAPLEMARIGLSNGVADHGHYNRQDRTSGLGQRLIHLHRRRRKSAAATGPPTAA